jgi:hypothetical protein
MFLRLWPSTTEVTQTQSYNERTFKFPHVTANTVPLFFSACRSYFRISWQIMFNGKSYKTLRVCLYKSLLFPLCPYHLFSAFL